MDPNKDSLFWSGHYKAMPHVSVSQPVTLCRGCWPSCSTPPWGWLEGRTWVWTSAGYHLVDCLCRACGEAGLGGEQDDHSRNKDARTWGRKQISQVGTVDKLQVLKDVSGQKPWKPVRTSRTVLITRPGPTLWTPMDQDNRLISTVIWRKDSQR